MPIWKLSPIDLQAEDWKYSTYKGDILIRAQNEYEARDIAKGHFRRAARITTLNTLLSPWPNPALVQCFQYESDGSWEADGLSAVLDPADSAV
jgi:hypothetical protein